MRPGVKVTLAILVVVCVAAVTANVVVRVRTERELRVGDLGAPPGFRRLTTTTTGSAFCFGP